MRKNPNYQLQYISGIPYLLAYGQGNADFSHDMRLNDTGVFLWEQLDNVSDTEELIGLCIDYFQCPEEQCASMESAVRQFISSLYSRGILLPEQASSHSTPPYTTLEIAGLFLRLYGPAEAFATELLAFETSKEITDGEFTQDIRVIAGTPAYAQNGTLLLRNESLTIVEGADDYILLFPGSQKVYETHLGRDGRNVNIFRAPQITSAGMEEIFYAIRICFLYFAQMHGILAVHSSSVLYRDKAWLFSAPSGTGKSTHAELWKNLLKVPIINGDLNLITLQDGTPTVHGTPWCGTSEIYHTDSHPLGGVIFLQQGGNNQVIPLAEDQKQLYLLHRCISPNWTKTLLSHNLSILKDLYQHILICRLICDPTEDAVHCIRDFIDQHLLS